MNWYRILTARVKKIASVTFFVNDSHKIAQPKDLLGLSSELANFFYYNSKGIEDFTTNLVQILLVHDV